MHAWKVVKAACREAGVDTTADADGGGGGNGGGNGNNGGAVGGVADGDGNDPKVSKSSSSSASWYGAVQARLGFNPLDQVSTRPRQGPISAGGEENEEPAAASASGSGGVGVVDWPLHVREFVWCVLVCRGADKGDWVLLRSHRVRRVLMIGEAFESAPALLIKDRLIG
jgi:hypothetical protein